MWVELRRNNLIKFDQNIFSGFRVEIFGRMDRHEYLYLRSIIVRSAKKSAYYEVLQVESSMGPLSISVMSPTYESRRISWVVLGGRIASQEGLRSVEYARELVISPSLKLD
jgi:hypothetical protein